MIKAGDIFAITTAKLRMYKARTFGTVIVASLLFGVIVAFSLISTGFMKSVDRFRQDDLTGRYIVAVNEPYDPNDIQVILRDPDLIEAAKKQYDQLVSEKTADAKRLNIPYTSALDIPPYGMSSAGEVERLNISDPNGIAREVVASKYGESRYLDSDQLNQIASQYGSVGVFAAEYYSIPQKSSLTIMDGESYAKPKIDTYENHILPDVINSKNIVVAPSEISDQFLLPGYGGWKPEDNSIPIVLPQNVIERLLGTESSLEKLDDGQKLDHLSRLRDQSTDLIIKACYRNEPANALVRDIEQYFDAESPDELSRVYAPVDPTVCENPVVIRDNRSEAERFQDDNQKHFDQKYGREVDPVSQEVLFRVVGISPIEGVQDSLSTGGSSIQASSLNDIINSLLKAEGVGQVIPKALYEQMTDEAKDRYADLFGQVQSFLPDGAGHRAYYVEFSDAAGAKRFIEEQGCAVQVDGVCKPEGRPYQAALAFSSSVALDDARSVFVRWFQYSVMAVAVVAFIMVSITIGRAVVDSRYETAVFRAIGFRCFDIVAIYTSYTAILIGFVLLLTFTFGITAAYVFDQLFSQVLTAKAQFSFSDMSMSKEFSLVSFDTQQISIVVLWLVAAGALGIVLPLVRNTRRSPIDDLRRG